MRTRLGSIFPGGANLSQRSDLAIVLCEAGYSGVQAERYFLFQRWNIFSLTPHLTALVNDS
jgi:hypothetical protein